jgi:serine protease Do
MNTRNGRTHIVIAAFAVLTSLSMLAGCLVLPPTAPGGTTPSSTQPVAPSQHVDPTWVFPSTPSTPQPDLPSIVDVVAEVRPAVVSVVTEMVGYDLFNQAYTQEAAGSGVIIDSSGYIITNNHVVEGAQDIQIELHDGTTYHASIVGADALTDIAVIKADAASLPDAPLGVSGDLAVGEWVVAIGNALGEGISASQGIVSRLDVSITVSGNTLRDLIQTTAAINPGNSGGPLVNMAGEVIGISSVKVASIGVEGMSYAISIDGARPIVQSLINQGYVTRPWLGVSLFTVDEFTARVNNLSVDEGALIVDVTDGSPADQAGLERGDVIVAFNGSPVKTSDDILLGIIGSSVGETIDIGYVRDGQQLTTTAQLSESPPPWN